MRLPGTIVRAGAAILPRGLPEASLEALAGQFSARNAAHAHWARLPEHVRERRTEPPETITALRPIPDGPWAGGHWLPRAAPVRGEHHVDRSSCPWAAPVALAEGLVPRDYQVRVGELVLERLQGLVVIPCGGGKTTAGIVAISRVASPALVLVPSLLLVEQWCAELAAKLAPGTSIGVVGGGRDQRDARIVVATVQTLQRWGWWDLYQWGRRFGLVVLDEAHHAPAETVMEVLAGLPARHRLGLTATPRRADGLEPLIGWSFGGALLEVTQGELEARGLVLAPRISWLMTGWERPRFRDLPPGRAAADVAAEAWDRDQVICDQLEAELEPTMVGLVLCARVDHCARLVAELRRRGVVAAELHGQLAAGVQRERLSGLRAGTIQVLVATQIADEALDLPELELVCLVEPGTNASRLQQRIGRALRPRDGKRPLILDCVDDGAGRWQVRERVAAYHALGWACVAPVEEREERHDDGDPGGEWDRDWDARGDAW